MGGRFKLEQGHTAAAGKGYNVTAVQIPLTSLADDVAVTGRILSMQKGPTILVGHSYGGVVITVAGANASNVVGLAYISAYAPDAGEFLGELNGRMPAAPGQATCALMLSNSCG